MKSKGYVECALGYWEIQEEDGKITALDFVGDLKGNLRGDLKGDLEVELIADLDEHEKDEAKKSSSIMHEAKKQLEEYFNGERKDFSLPISLEGTPFQKSVWQALQEIPYGTTKSYQEVATIVGNRNSVRAVGGANHHNPISIIVPCHRVIGKNGTLVGYGGGLDVKAFLLKLEETFLYT